MARSRSERRHNDWTHRFNKHKKHCTCWVCSRHTRSFDFGASDLRKLAALESSFQELDYYEQGFRFSGRPLTMIQCPRYFKPKK